MKPDEIRAAINEKVEKFTAISKDVSDENPPTDALLAEMTSLKQETFDLRKQLSQAEAISGMVGEMQAQGDWVRQSQGKPPTAPADVKAQKPARTRASDAFLADAAVAQWRSSMGLDGSRVVSDQMRIGASPRVDVGSLWTPKSALFTAADSASAGAFIENDLRPGVVDAGLRRPLTIRDVITNGTTDSDTIEFVRQVAQTNNAAPVAEATATDDGSGVKPESAMTWEHVTTTVKVIAHWMPATKVALADAGQLRTMIDSFLRYGLEEELEDQIVQGSGVGQNFTGIFNTTGTQTQAWDTDIFRTTREARGLVETVARLTPTAYVLSAATWQEIELEQDGNNRYYGGGPFALTTPRLWGLPVVLSEALPTGYGLVGDFRQAVVWDREQATIQVSDSHADFFIRNLVAILAEMRAAFGVLRPNAFVEIDVVA
jgi:HK97 family phage major capsid protein